ncbi:unnamed protein product [Paramecium pentaurelia]|uniref:Uncharacterized protein n=1 Tax=Paramecium pentaurelia TaxID=43138 RepID=A0A8S1WBR0_9CILI|nr:unnamed protein product [Paramecium pentaurelia]
MGNGCSGQREMTERSETLRQPSITLTKLIEQDKLISIVPTSQLTQIEIPNALLPSPSRQSISFEAVMTSKVRVPSEESQFQNQFTQIKEVRLTNNQSHRPKIQVPQRKHKKQEIYEIEHQYHSSSPKKQKNRKQISPLENQQQQQQQQYYDYKKTNKSNRKKSTSNQQKMKQLNEIEIISRRKYSDLPSRTEKTQVKRKISNSIDDHNFIIGTDCISKVKSYTPSPILKRKESDCETNSFQKKMVRFKDINYRRPGFVN